MIAPRRSRPAGIVLVLGLVTVMAACGSGDGEESGPAAPTEAATGDPTTPSAPDDTMAQAASGDTAEEASVTAVPFTDVELVAACLEGPVSETPTPTEPGVLADAEGVRYCVGPALSVGIESAAAVVAPFGPSIEPVLTEAGIDTFNLLAGECFDPTIGNSSCPSSQIAIVTDGRVLSAPTINAPEFARDQLVISGDFTIEEAGAMAEALAAHQVLTIRPVLLVLGQEDR